MKTRLLTSDFSLLTSPALRTAMLGLILSCGSALQAQEGAIRYVHDPVIIRQADMYYVFCSGPGVPVRRSRDLLNWELIGRVFDEDVPPWAKAEIPGANHVWAPDVSFFNDRFHLYYSVSTLGSQRSCIGLATNRTLDPANAAFAWVDHGKVLESFPDRMDYNAIDPNLVLDERGAPWLLFGSFWTGIKLVQLDAETAMRPAAGATIHGLAARPGSLAIEGAFLVRKGEHYYLFASIEHCCRGVASNYRVIVGRARTITGPYLDFNGRPMLEGGGTLVLAGYGEWRGPGHHGMWLEPAGDLFVHHMYDARAKGIPTMQIRPLRWTDDGWPVVGEPINSDSLPSKTRPRLKPADLAGTWRHTVDFGADEFIELLPDGRINAAAIPSRWTWDGELLKLHWPRAGREDHWVDACFVAPDGRSYVGRNQNGTVIRGLRYEPQ